MTTGGTDLRPGWEVFTSDGDRLGTVKEFTPDRLKVDSPMGPDFWLPTSAIAWARSNRVELGFIRDELPEYQLGS